MTINNRSPDLFRNIRLKNVKAVRKLLERDPDLVNSKDRDDRTPLHVASVNGWIDVAECLLEYGAHVNALDRWNNTPLGDAQANQKNQMVDLLRSYGGLSNLKPPCCFWDKFIKAIDAATCGCLSFVKLFTRSLDAKGLDRTVPECDVTELKEETLHNLLEYSVGLKRLPNQCVNDFLERYKLLNSHLVHQSGRKGVLCIDSHSSLSMLATGGCNNAVCIFDQDIGLIFSSLHGHSKELTDVKFIDGEEQHIVSCSSDKTVCLWRGNGFGSYGTPMTLHVHKDEVKAVSVHGNNKYAASVSKDKTWSLFDVVSGRILKETIHHDSKGFTCGEFHPCGLVLGTGSCAQVTTLWDVRTKNYEGTFVGHGGPVKSISFSPDFFLMATGAVDGLRIYDLRYEICGLHHCLDYVALCGEATSVDFDDTGRYLAVAGATEIQVFKVGDYSRFWSSPTLCNDPGNVLTVKFSKDCLVVGGSRDQMVHIFGRPEY